MRPARGISAIALTSAAVLLSGGIALAVAGGTAVPEGQYQFLARVTAGGNSCSGVLVEQRWVATSAACVPETGEVKATIGAHTSVANKVVRHENRAIALVRLAYPVANVTPIALGAGLAQGESLKVAGFGRTATDWVPDRPHVAAFTVASLTANEAVLNGEKDTCRGDSGGPAFREVNGTPQLVALNLASWQFGCFGESGTNKGTTETRVDDLAGWISGVFFDLTATPAPRHAIKLAWDAQGAQSFKVYASQNASVPVGPSTLVGTVTTPSFTHGALAAKATWHYRVVPVKGGQDGAASPVVSATTKLPTRSDFNGDGFDDVAAAYDQGSDRTTLPVWNGGPNGLGVPEVKWDSGNGQFTAWKARWLTGDFNGDGRSDAAAFYNYGSGNTSLFVSYATATGFGPLEQKWNSGPGNTPAETSRVVAGDFNADGRADIAAFYDHGSAITRMYVWNGTATGFDAAVVKWDSGAGGWDQYKATFLAADFTGDGRVDIAAKYYYGENNTALFLFEATAAGFNAPVQKWSSPNGWNVNNARYAVGDYNGDGRADIGAFYNYVGGVSKLLVFYATAAGFNTWTEKWSSGEGNTAAQTARVTAGDYTGDGKADIVGFYNESGVTRAYLWKGNPNGVDLAVRQWDGGAGNTPAVSAKVL